MSPSDGPTGSFRAGGAPWRPRQPLRQTHSAFVSAPSSLRKRVSAVTPGCSADTSPVGRVQGRPCHEIPRDFLRGFPSAPPSPPKGSCGCGARTGHRAVSTEITGHIWHTRVSGRLPPCSPVSVHVTCAVKGSHPAGRAALGGSGLRFFCSLVPESCPSEMKVSLEGFSVPFEGPVSVSASIALGSPPGGSGRPGCRQGCLRVSQAHTVRATPPDPGTPLGDAPASTQPSRWSGRPAPEHPGALRPAPPGEGAPGHGEAQHPHGAVAEPGSKCACRHGSGAADQGCQTRVNQPEGAASGV